MSRNIAIVGAGILGRVLALQLSQRGFKVHLFDRGSEDGREACSFAAAGMLSPYCEMEAAESFIFQLGRNSLSLWADILGQLPLPVFFQRQGSLVVAHPYDQSELDRLRICIQTAGVDDAGMRDLGQQDLQALEPQLESRFARGLYFPHEGQIDNRATLIALLAGLRKRQVECSFSKSVVALRAHEVELPEGLMNFDWVIDCRGLEAKTVLTNLRGVRGELFRLHAPDVQLHRPIRLMHPRYPLYIVPRPNQVFLVGATCVESDSRQPLTVRSALELLSAAYAVHPGFAEATILESVTQVRPAFSDNLPKVNYANGLMQINGLYRHGFLITPAVVEAVVGLIENGQPPANTQQLFQEAA